MREAFRHGLLASDLMKALDEIAPGQLAVGSSQFAVGSQFGGPRGSVKLPENNCELPTADSRYVRAVSRR